jgi:hypothetical protein
MSTTAGLLTEHDRALVDAIARRVVELLNEPGSPQTPQLVDAATIARTLGVSRSTVYEHAQALGAIEVGSGSRPRLRFDVDQAVAAWSRRVPSERSEALETPVLAEIKRRRRRTATRSGDDLLPIVGERAAESG